MMLDAEIYSLKPCLISILSYSLVTAIKIVLYSLAVVLNADYTVCNTRSSVWNLTKFGAKNGKKIECILISFSSSV